MTVTVDELKAQKVYYEKQIYQMQNDPYDNDPSELTVAYISKIRYTISLIDEEIAFLTK